MLKQLLIPKFAYLQMLSDIHEQHKLSCSIETLLPLSKRWFCCQAPTFYQHSRTTASLA
jgi:hypothetical protein